MVTLAPPMRSVPGLSFCVPTIWPKRLVQDPVIFLMETKWARPNRDVALHLAEVKAYKSGIVELRYEVRDTASHGTPSHHFS